jgi:AraC-like DNA-binding protein
VSASACLAGTGLREGDLADPELWLAAGQELTVIRNLLLHAGSAPGLGVRAGSRVTVGMLGIWGFAMLSSSTTRGVIEIAAKYGFGRLSWAFLRPWVDERADGVHIVYDDAEVPDDVRGFLTERDLVFTAALLPKLFGRPLPLRIRTKLDAGSARALATALPDCRFSFGAERNEQVLDRAALAAPLPNADEQAIAICERECAELLGRRGRRAGVSAVVRSSILHQRGGRPSLEQIARARHADVRTLRRQLSAEGTSFRELADEVQEALATELLRTASVTVEQVADRLGYADAASFTRAYKRWTGRTPGTVARDATANLV